MLLACLASVASGAGFSWEELKAPYGSPTSPKVTLDPEKEGPGGARVTRFEFKNETGAKVPGLLLLPPGKGPFPVVMLLHGLTSNKETMAAWFGAGLAKRGIASAALDADFHGERKRQEQLFANPRAFADLYHGSVREYRAALDFLATRGDLDRRRVGLAGYSMGAMMGTILAAVEPRVQASVLCVGGDLFAARAAGEERPAARAAMATLSPANYAPYISPRPVLFLNGKTDTLVNEAAAKALQNAAKEPKEIEWIDAGHLLPQTAIDRGLDWLTAKLKGVR